VRDLLFRFQLALIADVTEPAYLIIAANRRSPSRQKMFSVDYPSRLDNPALQPLASASEVRED